MKTQITEHGKYEIGHDFCGEFRTDFYTGSTLSDWESTHVTGHGDLSDVYCGKSDNQCACCAHGHAHSVDRHLSAIETTKRIGALS